ncbi:HdeD family acid-resistance protein [Haloarchaeobius sp. HME9146]|uniref:HdeD family acid-resistance protein n=1 Tax=Haloarchaeobius sp. HME9146 TaxID=2978732 RepID=UPI0021C0863C|nr:HdeD family acid-resistance protein [Haloarchaeobius sp. HME9146]MCT9096851.1 HdeD family acid-resistance protein [Haloarchaeobius sp. HME9146]
MSTDVTTEPATDTSHPELAESRGTLRLVGSLLVLFGLVAIVFPHVSTVSLALLLGTILVAGGVLQVAHAFSATNWRGFVWQGLVAVLFTGLGILVLVNPTIRFLSLWLLLVGLFLAVGLAQFVLGLAIRGDPNWQWPILAGCVSILAAVLLWLGLPATEPWAIGLVFGIALSVTGLSLVMLALGARPQAVVQEETAPAARSGER